MQDMLNEVLKFGSYIVDSLREFTQPIFVYLPPNSTLRGGAWVVVDATINARYMEMYADNNCRGGVLESEGTVDVKYRRSDIVATAHRLDYKLIELNKELAALIVAQKQQVSTTTTDEKERFPRALPEVNQSANVVDKISQLKQAISDREKQLLPIFHQVATQFADLHDTPGRMVAKGVIRDVVPWERSREYFYWRLRRRLLESEYIKQIESITQAETDSLASTSMSSSSWLAAQHTLRSFLVKDVSSTYASSVWNSDKLFLEWMEQHKDFIMGEVRKLEKSNVEKRLKQIAESHPNGINGAMSHLLSLLPRDQLDALYASLT